MDVALVGFKPGFGSQVLFLQVAGGVDVGGNAALRLLLVGGVERQLDVVAILRSGIGELADDAGHLVAFHDAGALPEG